MSVILVTTESLMAPPRSSQFLLVRPALCVAPGRRMDGLPRVDTLVADGCAKDGDDAPCGRSTCGRSVRAYGGSMRGRPVQAYGGVRRARELAPLHAEEVRELELAKKPFLWTL